MLLLHQLHNFLKLAVFVPCFLAAEVGDTGAEFDRVFLQELRDLKVFVNDREIAEEHKR